MQQSAWQFWIDVGGTFTDCFARRPDGSLVRHKLLQLGRDQGEQHRPARRQRRSSTRYAPLIPRSSGLDTGCVYLGRPATLSASRRSAQTRATERCIWRTLCRYLLRRGRRTSLSAVKRRRSWRSVTSWGCHSRPRSRTSLSAWERRGNECPDHARGRRGPPSSRRKG